MTVAEASGRPPVERSRKGTIFWRVAALLVGVQIIIGLLAVGLTALFAYDASLELVQNSLRLRLDGLAEEIELRAPALDIGLRDMPQALINDIATRFPDPVTVVTPRGEPVVVIKPDLNLFPEYVASANSAALPPNIRESLNSGDVHVEIDGGASFGLAPVYDATGFLAGGVVIHSLENSIDRELADTRAAFYRALAAITIVAGLVALIIGALLTWRLVRPLRSVTDQVQRIGQGDFSARLPSARDDEFGRLAESINSMADRVEESFDRLVSSDRLRRDLVANIGHDLRTPLTAMRGYIDEANRAMADGQRDVAIEMLQTASQQTIYISNLVSDLFELALLDSPTPSLRIEPVPLGELIAQAADGQRGLYRETGCTLATTIPPGLPTIRADGVRLLRLLNNLLDNARRHGKQKGEVTIEGGVDGERVFVCVLDDGPGIDPDSLDALFDRYYRGDGPRTRKAGSTGLGLAISRAIAEAHGGTLSVDNRVEGGARFELSLPAATVIDPA